MNVLLYLAPGGRSLPMPNLGLSVVASGLTEFADVELLDRSIDPASSGEGYDITLDCSDEIVTDASYALDSDFDVIGLQVHTGNLLESAEFLEIIRRQKIRAKVVIGGPSANLVYRTFSGRNLADYFVFGEGASAFRALATSSEIPTNALIASEGHLPAFAPYERAKDVPPPPNFKMLYGYDFDILPYLSTTGCIFNCSFCTSRRDIVGFQFRHEQDSVLEEYIELHRPRFIRFNDSSFNGHRPTFRRMVKSLISTKRPVQWGAYIALDSLREDEIPRMSASGCAYVYIGLESGDEFVRKNQNKRFEDVKAARLIQKLKYYGIKVLASFIIGLPGETSQSINKTRRLIELLEPDAVHFFPYEDRHSLSELVGQGEYWTALLGRTTHRILSPQNQSGFETWNETLKAVADLKEYFSSQGTFVGESDLVRHLLGGKISC